MDPQSGEAVQVNHEKKHVLESVERCSFSSPRRGRVRGRTWEQEVREEGETPGHLTEMKR